METLSATDALRLLRADPRGFVDVRAPVEFAKGAIPGFSNLPILDDGERARVGTCYAREGHAAAVVLGETLVAPTRAARIAAWRKAIAGNSRGFGVVTCWRGGLRSRFAAEWLTGAGVAAKRVIGGYRALRRHCLEVLAEPRELVVLSGLTGCGKTELLRDVPVHRLDIEALACHRGSAFGARWDAPQPAQAVFENAIALELLDKRGAVLVEDESATLGQLFLPPALREAMARAPLVVLEAPLAARVARIRAEYIDAPLGAGVAPARLVAALDASLTRIANRLGGELCQSLRAQLASGEHDIWIERLLVDYYDKTYTHALRRSGRTVRFRGDAAACRAWLLNLASAPAAS